MLRIQVVMAQEGRRLGWLAKRLGISLSQLSRMLSGERPWTQQRRERAKAALGWGDELFDEVASALACPVCGGEGIVERGERIDGREWIGVCPGCKGLGVVVVSAGSTDGATGQRMG